MVKIFTETIAKDPEEKTDFESSQETGSKQCDKKSTLLIIVIVFSFIVCDTSKFPILT
jgi:hypothetical protein